MQQENVKKGKKLGWLIAGLAVLLVIVGVVLALILMPGEQASKEPTGPVGGRPQLYWNIWATTTVPVFPSESPARMVYIICSLPLTASRWSIPSPTSGLST